MAINYQVFSDVSGVTLGGTSIYGVQSVSVSRQSPAIRAAGDDDVYESVARGGAIGVFGTIELLDPAQAEALGPAVGTLSFTWHDARGGTDKSVSITGVSVTEAELSAARHGSSKALLSFTAESTDGATDPVSVS